MPDSREYGLPHHKMPGADLPRLEVVAAILIRDDTFLVAQRPAGKPMAGYWEFPGGKTDSGETPEHALARELAEELGIVVEKTKFLRVLEHPYPENGFIVRLRFFLVRQWLGEPQAREGQHLAWITGTEAEKLNFLPADKEIVVQLGRILAEKDN